MEERKTRRRYLIIILLMAFLLLCMLIYIFSSNDNGIKKPLLDLDGNASEWSGEQQLPGANKTKGIDIPGFKSLVLIADQRIQKVNFYNPNSNSVLFQMTLYADGEEIWNSKLVEPGNGFYEITLSQVLSEGTYDGALRYQCFREDGTELNSARMHFDLIVREE